jgi:glycosyltransferase involved in cell wall biosynthesis
VVLIHRYFYPDTPLYASLLRTLALRLGDIGYRVTVITAQPSYTGASSRAPAREHLHPMVEVRRFSLFPETRKIGAARLANTALYLLRVLLSGIRLRDVNVVMGATSPPIVGALAASLVAKLHRAAFVYHNQDIYPEVASAAGILRRPRLAGFLRAVDSRNHRHASRIVVLSEDMRQTIGKRQIPLDRVRVINNFDPFGSAVTATASEDRGDQPTLRIAFAGNLGRFQGLEQVVEAANLVKDMPVRLDVLGDGVLRAKLEQYVIEHGLTKVRLHGFQPSGQVESFLAANTDLGIVSLAPGVIRTAYPSKTFSYLRCGCAVIACVEADSELAQTLTEHNVGMVCPPGDAGALSEVIKTLVSNPAKVADMRSKSRAFSIMALSAEHRLAQWEQLFSDLMEPEPARSQ